MKSTFWKFHLFYFTKAPFAKAPFAKVHSRRSAFRESAFRESAFRESAFRESGLDQPHRRRARARGRDSAWMKNPIRMVNFMFHS